MNAAVGHEPMSGPLEVEIIFRFPMPASRPKQIRERLRVWKTTTPDIDKLCRSTLDGLTDSAVIADDRYVAVLVASKYETSEPSGATITIRELT
jgi:crossover junction endodeoxyribonuclease RusA